MGHIGEGSVYFETVRRVGVASGERSASTPDSYHRVGNSRNLYVYV